MKLPKIPNPFKKSAEEDDDDFEGGFDEEFDAAPAPDDSSAATTVIDDDDAAPPDADADDVATGSGGDDEDGLDLPPLPGGRTLASIQADDEEDGLEMPELPGGRSVTDLGSGDVDRGEDIDFDQFDDEIEEKEGRDRRKHLMIIAAGVLVLVGGMIGGASWWYFGSGDGAQTAATDKGTKGPRVEFRMPPKPGTAGAQLMAQTERSGTSLVPPPLNAKSETPSAPLTPPPAAESDAAGKPAATSALTPSPPSPVASPAASDVRAGPAGGDEPKLARAAGDIGGRFGGQAEPLSGTLNRLGGAASTEGAGIVVPAVTSGTVRAMPDHPGGKPLGPTPDARIVEKKEGLPGPLPIANKDATPWQAYARPFETEHPDWPKVAVAIVGLGLSRAATMSAIAKLPPQVTLTLDPYARDLNDWTVRARLVGHEVMVQLPMEDERFPVVDAGPLSMDTGVNDEANITRLEKLLSSLNGYTGVVTHMGSRFGTSEKMMTPVMEALNYRGLLFLAVGIQTELAGPKIAERLGMPRVLSDLVIDGDLSAEAIDANLSRLEGIIRQRSRAVAVAHAYPLTLSRLIPWLETLNKKQIELVPVSALADTTKSVE